jgi:hypothetical protein
MSSLTERLHESHWSQLSTEILVIVRLLCCVVLCAAFREAKAKQTWKKGEKIPAQLPYVLSFFSRFALLCHSTRSACISNEQEEDDEKVFPRQKKFSSFLQLSLN